MPIYLFADSAICRYEKHQLRQIQRGAAHHGRPFGAGEASVGWALVAHALPFRLPENEDAPVAVCNGARLMLKVEIDKAELAELEEKMAKVQSALAKLK